MRIRNAEIYNPYKKCFIRADVTVRDGKFEEILYTGSSEDPGVKIIPGFIDVHSHGAAGVDMMSADCDKLAEMSAYYAKNGVTSLFPSTVSAKHEDILKMIGEVGKAKSKAIINLAGIHLEGPYINKNKAGAHAIDMIRDPDLSELDDILSAASDFGLKLHITVAPELDGAFEFITAAVKRGATISLGHTEASVEILRKAVKLGARSFTHLFNAMPPIHHRNAGVAGFALASDETYAEAICDGIHLCPEVVKLICKAKGLDGVILVSDSTSAAGFPEGEYNLGPAKKVLVKDGRAFIKNPDGSETIAGSTTNLYTELQNFMNFTGKKLEDALVTITRNPAECVGIYASKGSIETGKDADFIILDDDSSDESETASAKTVKIKEVYINGEMIKN